ncbi:MAG: 30S ribosomal protein THX [Proteobacteria bacterium]|nr:30S ribosomal protein THX [Pseudomonadota bacterium]
MGKGDIRTRRGKIARGTFGNARPQKPKKPVVKKSTTKGKK